MKHFLTLLVVALLSTASFAQFGQNKVQYKEYTWFYIQTMHFDVYFSQDGSEIAGFAANAAEEALKQIERLMNHKINNRITIILFNSQNDFQETNVTDEYLSENVGGFTELFKNRVVLPYNGDYKAFRHVIHHELVHAVVNDMFYGGAIQNIIANNIQIRLPLWFNEGLAEYLSLGWDTNTDMYIRDAASNEYLPDIPQLDGYFAYRGGQSVWHYIAKKYGEEKIGELLHKIKSKGNVEEGIFQSLGLKIDELNERWKKDIKRRFWPDISKYSDPDEFSKRLTDHRKEGGFYNTSPALSPQGDRLAFISNRDFFFDVYLMNAADGKIIKKLVKGSRTPDFEELNILTPGLSWSPDGRKIALAAKSGGYDVVYIIDVESEDMQTLQLKLGGIGSVHWSPDGSRLVFAGHNAQQSDIYIYQLQTGELTNITNDKFSDRDPVWSPDGKKIYFASDRADLLTQPGEQYSMIKHNYTQTDLYCITLSDKSIIRITNLPISSESSPACSPDGKEILFVSDLNGINNIFKKRIELLPGDTVKSITALPEIPVTNSMSGLYQLSLSQDGKKLAFSSLYQSAFNIFVLNHPFDYKPETKVNRTLYVEELLNPQAKETSGDTVKNKPKKEEKKDEEVSSADFTIFTGQYIDTTKNKNSKDYSGYVFGGNDYVKIDTIKKNSSEIFEPINNLDSAGNYRVNKYKITFSPDIIYANAGYSSLYGLLGTTVISFSDVLGNHRLVGQTSLQIDLKNSDYGLSYYYMPKRIDYGIEAFHTARFVYLQRSTGDELFRFRNYGAVASMSYPLNRFYRLDAGLSFLNVSSENLDNPDEDLQKVVYLLPAVSFIHDNTIFGYTSPIEGTRYRLDLLANGLVQKNKNSFYSLLADYRTYLRFWGDYSFVFRYTGGLSRGNKPQRFFIGGIENWINRNFTTGTIPLESPADFAFLTPVLPMRGFNYAEKLGTTYSLVNLELRYPLIRYLLSGALPILFTNVLGTAFIDAGAMWGNNSKQLQLFSKDANGNLMTKDALIGTGLGARMYLLYFLLRFDVAWSYNMQSFSQPKFYISLGADF